MEGGGEGGGREGREHGQGTGGAGPKKPLEQAAGPRPGEGKEGGGRGAGGSRGWWLLFCVIQSPCWCLAGFLRIASLPLLAFPGGSTLLWLLVCVVGVPVPLADSSLSL